MQPSTDQIHSMKVAMDCRQSNTIPEFWVLYSENWSSDQYLNHSVITKESSRSNWIKSIRQVKLLFDWRQSIATFTPWILSVGGCIVLKILVMETNQLTKIMYYNRSTNAPAAFFCICAAFTHNSWDRKGISWCRCSDFGLWWWALTLAPLLNM